MLHSRGSECSFIKSVDRESLLFTALDYIILSLLRLSCSFKKISSRKKKIRNISSEKFCRRRITSTKNLMPKNFVHVFGINFFALKVDGTNRSLWFCLSVDDTIKSNSLLDKSDMGNYYSTCAYGKLSSF